VWEWSETVDPNLKWVTEVGVRVDATGVSVPQLASEIEQRLRQAGIAVVSPPVPGPDGTPNTLSVAIAVTPSVLDINQSSLRTQVRLVAWLRSVGDRSGRIFEGPMWITEARSQIVNNASLDIQVRQDVEYLVGEFITAYRSVHQQS